MRGRYLFWLVLACSSAAVVLVSSTGGMDRTGQWDGGPAAVVSKQPARQGLASLPVAAQSVISAALGAETPRFSARRSAGGYRIGGGGVAARLDTEGVALHAGGVSVAMTVASVGRGGRLDRPNVVSVGARANRVSLDRGGLTEWYAAGPLGIEQGFTLSRRPAGAAGPVELGLRLDGDVRARQAPSGEVFLTRPGLPGMRYGAVSTIDSAGRSVRSEVRLHDGGLLIRVWDRGASYPLVIDPLIQQGGKLTASDQIGTGQFGYSVALSSDGNTALIGGPEENEGAGAAWVFTRAGSTWTQQAKLTGSDQADDARVGAAVALSSDGSTALIGGPNDDDEAGAAWVFTRSDGTWTEQAKLTGSGATGAAELGYAVALSADGNTALVSGPGDDSFVGAAWVFTRSGTSWTQPGPKLKGSNEIGVGYFGQSVALSADGNTALIGGDGDNELVGAAWVFTRPSGTWEEGPKLTGTGGIGTAQFGWSVALSSDGNTALIGGPDDNGSVGAAWVFTRSSGTWEQQGAKLTGSGEIDNADFGQSVDLSSDGNTALVGGWLDNGGVGAAWVFTRSDATWTQEGAKLTGAGEIAEGSFGYSVALSSAGDTALIGGPDDDSGIGAAWVFSTATATVPGAPTAVSAVAGNAQATVSFTAPASDGGAAITSYTVTASPGGATASGAASPIAVTGLTNGTAYTFTVTATNSVGTGPPSAASSAVTPATVPGAPTGVSAGPGDARALVSFTAPVSNGGAAITSYTVTASPGGATASGAASPISVTGLTNGTAYTFTVTATNSAGTGPSSSQSSPVTPATVPGAPTGVTAVAGNAQATVSFTPPASNGGAAISMYTVTASPGGASASGSASPIAVAGLTNGTAYTFTVTATNSAGTGPPSAASSAVTPATVPGAPTAVSAVAGNAQATVSFTPPASNGGASITSYTVTASPGGASASGSASPISVTGLTNGTAYTFTVTATNSAGTGAPSTASSPVTPATVPGAPTAVSAVAGNAQATVSFTAPASNGGAAVTSYTVTASPGGATASGATSPIVVTGLANGTAYTFTVTATNSAGTGSPSSASNSVTPSVAPTVPEPPTAVSAVAGNAQATVSFTAPASDGGAAVTSYTVTASPGGATGSGTTSPIVVSGLSNGTAYTFTVTARNSVGTGPPSAASAPVTPATVPGAPTGLSAVAGNAQATVSFTAPASNGGAAITSYTVVASPGGATGSGTASPIVVSGLSNGTAYTFAVTATNAAGTGPPSALSSPVTPSGGGASVPGAPTGVLVSAGDGAVTVSFAAPASDGGAVITQYTVTVSPGGQTVSRYAGPVFVSGLTNGTSYTFTVTATNSVGSGPPSSASAAVVPTATGGRPAPPPPAAVPRPNVPDPPGGGPRPPAPN